MALRRLYYSLCLLPQQIQSELPSVTERLERTKGNGQTLIEKTKDDEEKVLIQSTLDSLAEQMTLVKSWIEEKKNQVTY